MSALNTFFIGTLLSITISAQEGASFASPEFITNQNFSLRLGNATAPFVTLQRSTDLAAWESLTTAQSAATNSFDDSGAVYRDVAFYRAVERDETNIITGDHLATENGDVVFHPIDHASLLMSWNGLIIYNDPAGSASLYTSLPRADLILVSHEHGDHFNASILSSLRRAGPPETVIVAPRLVFDQLNATMKALTIVLTNGATTNLLGARIEAVPAYNGNHSRGAGNGYVLTLGGKRIYMSGDTGDTAEMKALPNIDVAFLCMNQPFTMTVAQAAGAVREFKPRVVYPYHFRNQGGTFSDLNLFRAQVGTEGGTEVRVRDWY